MVYVVMVKNFPKKFVLRCGEKFSEKTIEDDTTFNLIYFSCEIW